MLPDIAAGYREFVCGNLARALDIVDSALSDAREPISGAPWRVLRAEVLIPLGKARAALTELAKLPSDFQLPEIVAIRSVMVRGQALTVLAQYAAASDALDAAWNSASTLQDRRLMSEIQIRRGTLRFRLGKWPEAEECQRSAFDLASAVKDEVLLANALAAIGQLRLHQKDYEQALEWSGRALAIAERIGARRTCAAILSEMGLCHLRLRDPDRAGGMLKQAESLAVETGASSFLQYCLGDLGNWHMAVKNVGAAIDSYRRALDLAEQAGDVYGALKWAGNLEMASMKAGRFLDAVRYRQKAKQLDEVLKQARAESAS